MKIQATRSVYQNPHQANLTSTNIRPVPPYTQEDIHDAFENLSNQIYNLGGDLIAHNHIMRDGSDYMSKSFEWYPQKKKVKQRNGKYQMQKKRFVTRTHRLRHKTGPRNGEVYTVSELLLMLEDKINHTMKGNNKQLQDFTEAMLHRSNLSLKWFKDLAEKYFGHDIHCQRRPDRTYDCVEHCNTHQWHKKFDEAYIKIDWV